MPNYLIFLIGGIALLHLYILWLEMFAWTGRGKKVFRGLPEALFEPTRTLAANQGLYNGFLSAGLIWSLFLDDSMWAFRIAAFFLSCIAIAGIFGAITVHRKIFFIQAFPALIGLMLISFNY